MEHRSEPENGKDAVSRYTRDMRESRRAVREVMRSDVPAARLGPGVTVVLLIVVAGSAAGPRRAPVVAAVFGAWFLLAPTVVHTRGGRGGDAVRRACTATFGWGQWF
ncbi:hypothetical protein ACIQCR_17325 [Streptomyces sp. NPDC093249]|uniref:hypothetical protein n=1 Tax=unclassified Streptomyces TaxID=2593676 RepID=UPI003450393B